MGGPSAHHDTSPSTASGHPPDQPGGDGAPRAGDPEADALDVPPDDDAAPNHAGRGFDRHHAMRTASVAVSRRGSASCVDPESTWFRP
jgi:hypothetical protein